MEISMSTFYSTFGDKEALFLSALKSYEAKKRSYASVILGGDKPAAAAFQKFY